MTASKTITTHCEKHKLTYEAVEVLGFTQPCPECQREIREAVEAMNASAKAAAESERQATALKWAMDYIRESGMPKRYIDFKPEQTENFTKHAAALKAKAEGVVFISGAVGTGKTLFACQMLKFNALKKPLYLAGQDLAILGKGDYALTALLKSIACCGMLVIDEANYFLENIVVFDLIVDSAYRDAKPLILVANCEPKPFFDKVGQRIASRLAQDFKHLRFDGADLRTDARNG